jgi:hypothetical protein
MLFLLFYLFRFGAPILFPGFQVYPVQSEGQEIMIIWTIYNFSLVSVALLCCIEKPSRRNSERFNLEYIVRISTPFDNLTYWGLLKKKTAPPRVRPKSKEYMQLENSVMQ